MNPTAVLIACVAGGAMLVDWWAVHGSRGQVENVAKPAVMVGLIGVALAADLDPTSAQPWIVAALALGLAGDVFLLPRIDRFIEGLGSFLLGHLAYLVAFGLAWSPNPLIAVGPVGIVVLLRVVGIDIVRSVTSSSLRWPVTAYIAVTVAIVLLGTATGRWLVALGALAFASSDGVLGSDRFVRPAPHRRHVVHILYHLGQAAILAGFIAG